MKSNSQYTFITLAFLLSVIISCSKDAEVDLDNLDAISGTYVGQDSSNYSEATYNPTNNTITKTNRIKVKLKTYQVVFKRDSMLVYFGKDKFILNAQFNGGYWFGSNGGREQRYIQFRNDSVIYESEVMTLVNWTESYYIFLGKKKK